MKRLENSQALYVRRKMEIIVALMTLGIVLISIRAVDLHVLKSDDLQAKASKQHFRQYTVSAPRGTITDRHGRMLSKSIEVPSIGVMADELPAKRMPELAKALHIPLVNLEKRLKNRSGFTWLARQVSPAIAEQVKELNITGVRLENEWKRFHPLGPETGHVLGFVGIDGHGLEGLERTMDTHLQGQEGTRLVQRDARGHSLPDGIWLQEPKMGKTLALTIDSNIQSIAYAALTDGIKKQHAKGGSIIVMQPHTGDILAMASWPGFNPNSFTKYNARQWRNRAVTDMLEPGSAMKPFTVATALESKRWQPSSLVFCENGNFKVADYTIHDDHAEGWLDLEGIIARSSNIGAAKIAIDLGASELWNHLNALGFGQRLSIGMGGESPGILAAKDKWGIVETANIAFGQGIAVTPLQLAAAFSVLGNHGVKVLPRIIASDEAKKPQRIFSKQTTQAMTKMLMAATSADGTGFRSVPAGYHVAGKTGTAQKPDQYGAYAKDEFTAVFAGFAPAEFPEIVIVVVIDEPQESIYGGVVAAPVFRHVAASTLPYLGVPPETPSTQDWQLMQTQTSSSEDISNSPLNSGIVSDYSHKSLRQAYGLADQQHYSLITHGSGWVVRQKPVALSSLPRGAEVEVWLHE